MMRSRTPRAPPVHTLPSRECAHPSVCRNLSPSIRVQQTCNQNAQHAQHELANLECVANREQTSTCAIKQSIIINLVPPTRQ
eukprot:6475482-Prymnesium_polylepis.1